MVAGLSAEGSERKTDRIEAFTDAVLAIAITLPILDIKLPRLGADGDLAGAYRALAPSYVAYALSVVVIGLYWSYSHFSGKIFLKTDHGFNLLTVVFLALVSATPFPARPFVEHVGDANAPAAATVYAGLLAAPSIAWTVRWQYARRVGLLDPHLSSSYLRKVTLRYAVTSLVLLAGTALTAIVNWRLGLAVIALATLSFVFPPRKPEFKPGEEPDDELQEADERRSS